MSHDNFWLWLNNNLFQAGMNVEYHQTVAWWYWTGQSALTIAALTLAVVGVALSGQRKLDKWSWRLGIFGLLSTCILLVFPLNAWETQANRFACEWSGIRGTLDDMERQFKELPDNDPLSKSLCDGMKMVDARKSQLQSSEPSPWPSLLQRCYGDQVERMHGPGIRTAEKAKEVLEANARNKVLDQPQRPAPEPSA